MDAVNHAKKKIKREARDKWLNQVKPIIEQLKEMDVDGEQMQYILEKVGMDEQMYNQLNSTFK